MAKRTVKKSGKKKVSKKAAAKTTTARGRKTAKAAASAKKKQKILPTSIEIPGGMFSKQATAQIIGLILSKEELEAEDIDLKGKRDLVRQAINGDEKEIQNLADSYKPSNAIEEADFTKKLVGLIKDRSRRQNKYDELTKKISEVNSKIRTLFTDLAKLVAKEDKTGTLYEYLDLDGGNKAKEEPGKQEEPKLALAE